MSIITAMMITPRPQARSSTPVAAVTPVKYTWRRNDSKIGATRSRGTRAATLSDSWIPPSISRSACSIPFLPLALSHSRASASGAKAPLFPV